MVTPTTTPLAYLGVDSQNPRDTFYRRRAPTSSDLRAYSIGDRWINTQSSSAFILVSKTNTSSQWEAIGGGSTQVASLTGNDAIPVGPIAGNINISGISGLRVINTAPATISLDNLRDLSDFVVSSIPGDSEYSSIQGAINAAAAVGGGIVFIKQGTYIEDLTMGLNVQLIGVTEDPLFVLIDGTVFIPIGVANIALKNLMISNLTSGTGHCISEAPFPPRITFNLLMENVVVTQTNPAFDAMNYINGGAGTNTNTTMINCTINGGGEGCSFNRFNHLTAWNCTISGITKSASSNSLSLMNFYYCNLNGQVALQTSPTNWISYCNIISGATEAIDCFSATDLRVVHCIVDSTAASGFWATSFGGGGTLNKADVVLTGTALGIDPAIILTTYPIV